MSLDRGPCWMVEQAVEDPGLARSAMTSSGRPDLKGAGNPAPFNASAITDRIQHSR
jgi:hypothetical protein